MNLMKYIERMRAFHEREGYFPVFGETQRHEQGDWELEPEPEQPTRHSSCLGAAAVRGSEAIPQRRPPGGG